MAAAPPPLYAAAKAWWGGNCWWVWWESIREAFLPSLAYNQRLDVATTASQYRALLK